MIKNIENLLRISNVALIFAKYGADEKITPVSDMQEIWFCGISDYQIKLHDLEELHRLGCVWDEANGSFLFKYL